MSIEAQVKPNEEKSSNRIIVRLNIKTEWEKYHRDYRWSQAPIN